MYSQDPGCLDTAIMIMLVWCKRICIYIIKQIKVISLRYITSITFETRYGKVLFTFIFSVFSYKIQKK